MWKRVQEWNLDRQLWNLCQMEKLKPNAHSDQRWLHKQMLMETKNFLLPKDQHLTIPLIETLGDGHEIQGRGPPATGRGLAHAARWWVQSFEIGSASTKPTYPTSSRTPTRLPRDVRIKTNFFLQNQEGLAWSAPSSCSKSSLVLWPSAH